MPPARFYVDTSAFVKLVVRERESDLLEAALEADDRLLSSDLLMVEAMRALRRAEARVTVPPEQAFRRVSLVRISVEIRDRAAVIGSSSLRTLDAIHLATADALRDRLDGLISYDERLIDAAAALGIRVLSPR